MKLTNVSVIKDLMNRHGVVFKKSLGQNFLINPSVCPRMAATVVSAPEQTVVEIGAGIGVLTRELSKVASRVIVIEIDEKLKPILDETLADCDNVEIIWGDALQLIRESLFNEPVSVVANLPYYAATHIIMQLFESELPISSITVMVQEEVAQRFTALPGGKQYGMVSVAARFFSTPEMLFKVSRGSFLPAPNVDSAVIRCTIHDSQPIVGDDRKGFFQLVRAAFSERRKQLCNPVSKEFGIDKDMVRGMLANPNARAEELSLEEFIKLYENISNRNIMR
jgi:16S rRNA (adenine1518-N6/adenine1519-N6)-dimethyltransferase